MKYGGYSWLAEPLYPWRFARVMVVVYQSYRRCQLSIALRIHRGG